MKMLIKKIFPKSWINILTRIFYKKKITNVFKKKNTKKVLISYITQPFKRNSFGHTNFYEVTTAANIFNELNYNVDVIYYEGVFPNIDSYDVFYGFGDIFEKCFEIKSREVRSIYYGAGMHVSHQNTASLSRVKDVYKKKNKWLLKSSRVVKKTWSHQTMLVDGIIALGNYVCADSYRHHYDGKIFSVPAPFYKVLNANNILLERESNADKSFLWFGSSGLIHKGLDLCLEFFIRNKEYNLHICGDIYAESDFIDVYRKEIFGQDNIIVHGFIDISSKKFENILKLCSFAIFPSCSEGGAPSVVTVVGNGALIPIVSKSTSFSTGYEIMIDELTLSGIQRAVKIAGNMSHEEILKLQKLNLDFVLKENNQYIYKENLKKAIKEILND